MSREISEHLRYYKEIGVDGVSRDRWWRTRGAEPVGSDAIANAEQPLPTVPLPIADVGDSRTILAALKEEIGPRCTRCKLHTLGRKQVVFGVGNPKADLMFVGEGPGADEDEQGEPFVGRAGQLLTKIIEAISLKRDDVYIANEIKPKVIVALGKFAAQSLLKTNDPITRLRGREFTYRDAILMPTYHPAYLLRTPSAKREVWEDMKRVRDILAGGA